MYFIRRNAVHKHYFNTFRSVSVCLICDAVRNLFGNMWCDSEFHADALQYNFNPRTDSDDRLFVFQLAVTHAHTYITFFFFFTSNKQ